MLRKISAPERKPPESLDAWDLVMRALSHFWRLTSRDNAAAQSLLDKAIAIDPNYGRALGVLAVSHTFDAQLGWKDRNGLRTDRPSHGPGSAACRRRGSLGASCAWRPPIVNIERYEDSLAEFEAALRLNPNFPLALGTYGLVLCWCDRWKEGNEAARRALLMSPRDPFSAIYNGVAAYAEFLDRNYDESIRLARDGIRQRADFVASHRMLTAAAGMAGRIDLAKAALQDLRRIHPGVSLAWMASQVQVRLPWQREHYPGRSPPRGPGIAADLSVPSDCYCNTGTISDVMPAAPPLIAYAHVGKIFDGRGAERVVAVDDVSLDVAEGEFLAIVGGSGSGKTTLLRLANRLIEADRGSITVEGQDVRNVDPIAAAPPHRLCLPERRAVSASQRRRQYRHHAETSGHGRRRIFRRGSTSCSSWYGSTAPNIATGCRMNCRAASASASAWPARSPQNRVSC